MPIIPLDPTQHPYRSDLPPLQPERVALQQPDAHWGLVVDDQLVGRYSLWYQQTSTLAATGASAQAAVRVGMIGHYAVADDPTIGNQLLDHACGQLAAQGCTVAIAPIDGSTWFDYRLVTEAGTEPAFWLEPDQPASWQTAFWQQGFEPIAQYRSAVNRDLTQRDPRLQTVRDRLHQLGIRWQSPQIQDWQQHLQQLYPLIDRCFAANFLYTPIPESVFITLYQSLLPQMQPELVLLAYDRDRLIGVIFALPDHRNPHLRQLVIKTVAVLPERRYAGLGQVLVEEVQMIGDRLGYQQAIHALMHTANPSANLSDRYAQTIRRYGLFAKALQYPET